MAVFSDVAEESKTASWVGSPGIFLVNRIMKENAGGTQTGAKTERGTDQREGHTAICKTKLSPSLGGTPLFAGWWWPASGTGSKFKKRIKKMVCCVRQGTLKCFF